MEKTDLTNPINILQSRIGEEWPAIQRARRQSQEINQRLTRLLEGLSSTDAAIVVFGSLARSEWTKSDVDWTLLIDGQDAPEHLGLAQKIGQRLDDESFARPGASGIFGNMTFSHDLVQKIGGREDTNENTTRRVLLIQESKAFGKADAHTRTLKHIFSRYLKDDWGLRFGSHKSKVPRVLLNDIVRYWRTVTVDFVDKQRGQAGHGWGLRNAKLRMSRKLIFATGMLSCFSCELLGVAEVLEDLTENHSTIRMEEYLRNFVQESPLDILATILLERHIKPETALKLFSSYNAFLALLDDAEKRDHLKELRIDEISTDAVFAEVRKISRTFQDGLTALFFNDDEKLRNLTIFYGVF
jgi:predicted nucleotidyltransferase